jgi:ComF family protein
LRDRRKPCDIDTVSVLREIRAGLSPLVDLVYPPRCPACGSALARQDGLCADCWNALETPGNPACTTCGQPIAQNRSGDLHCWLCRQEAPRHNGIRAATVYNDISRDLVLKFKHGGKLSLAALMAQMMARTLEDAMPGNEPLLVPVPLHRVRLWERGYNQAALLADELARRGKGTLSVDLLERRRRTPSLGGLGREERRRVLADAIAVRAARRKSLKGRSVILVDDVYTSGATSAACVEALLDGGGEGGNHRVFCEGHRRLAHIQAGLKSETPEAMKTPGAT